MRLYKEGSEISEPKVKLYKEGSEFSEPKVRLYKKGSQNSVDSCTTGPQVTTTEQSVATIRIKVYSHSFSL